MRIATYNVDAEDMLERAFAYLVSHGLENVTMRRLCNDTGLALGSMYYWFKNKDELVIEVAVYGMKKVFDEIFNKVHETMHDLNTFFSHFIDAAGEYKNELRFIYQIAASPVYGDIIRMGNKHMDFIYSRCIQRLSELMNCSENALRPLVYLFTEVVFDYVIWDNSEKFRVQLEFIYSVLKDAAIKSDASAV